MHIYKTIVGAIITLLAIVIMGDVSATDSREFDHFETSYPLTGMHVHVDCSECHVNGVFRGTPQQCGVCHNGVYASGKPANHVQSSNVCDDCHTTFNMADARFVHDNVVGPCSGCHNSVTATGKDPGHITTSLECDGCHITTSWLNVRFDHSMITAPCSSCHNGVTATGKDPDHIVTTQECDGCHNTVNWTDVQFDHTFVTGSCSSCHNNVDATGKPADHALTSDDCVLCHTTVSWTQIIFVHSSISEHNASVTCADCHVDNNYAVSPYIYPAYAPDCAGCHSVDFKIDSHKKTEVPATVFYTVDELRDCSGSCHLYDDNTFTTIKELRSGEHRINDSQF